MADKTKIKQNAITTTGMPLAKVLAEEPALKVVSFGAGVQSTTMLCLIKDGILEKPDALIFADTQWEPKEVYEHLRWCDQVALDLDLPLIRVTKGDLRADTLRSVEQREGDSQEMKFSHIPPLRQKR